MIDHPLGGVPILEPQVGAMNAGDRRTEFLCHPGRKPAPAGWSAGSQEVHAVRLPWVPARPAVVQDDRDWGSWLPTSAQSGVGAAIAQKKRAAPEGGP